MKEFKENTVYTHTATIGDQIPLPKGKCITKVDPYYDNKVPSTHLKNKGKGNCGVLGYYTIEEWVDFINEQGKGKKGNDGFLKGLFTGGTNGKNQTQNFPFLFWDVDVKTRDEKYSKYLKNRNDKLKKGSDVSDLKPRSHRDFKDENLKLHKEHGLETKRRRVISYLEKISVMYGFSSSESGLFGIFSVKGLENFSAKENKRHLDSGKKVCELISNDIYNKIGVRVVFDNRQSQHRQVRYTAQQKDRDVFINPNYTTYHIEESEKNVTHISGLKTYKNSDGSSIVWEGSIRSKFNDLNPIEDTLKEANLTQQSGKTWLHPITSSDSTGRVYGDAFKAFSGSFLLRYGSLVKNDWFDSFAMACIANNMTLQEFYSDLASKGWSDDKVDIQRLYNEVKNLETEGEIYNLLIPMMNQDISLRMQFFEQAPIPENQREIYRGYLKIKELKVEYDQIINIKIGETISDVLPEILELSKKHKKMCLVGDTGLGKTYAFTNVDNLNKIAPESRFLIEEPLISIVEQVKKKDGVCAFTGVDATKEMFDEAREAKVVVSTHTPCIAVMDDSETREAKKFTHLILDEQHSNILGGSFRRDTLADFFCGIKSFNGSIIAMTGTPIKELRYLGYYMIKVEDNREPEEIIVRYDGRKNAQNTILQHHLEEVAPKNGKAIYRLDSKADLLDAKNLLIEHKVDKTSILFISGKDKSDKAFEYLTAHDKFPPHIKIVLTTSVIDEGVSVENPDFTDIVHIDKMNSKPRPEIIKQFSARFRNKGKAVNYFYRMGIKNEYDIPYENQFEESIKAIEDSKNSMKNSFGATSSGDIDLYKDGNVNMQRRAFVESKAFFDSLTASELYYYCRVNYNLKMTIDTEWEKGGNNAKSPKLVGKKLYDTIQEAFNENWEDVLGVISKRSSTSSKLYKELDEMEKNTIDILPYVEQLVDKYFNHFVKYVQYYLKFQSISDDPTFYVLDGKGDLTSPISLERKWNALKEQYSYQDFQNNGDEETSDKYDLFFFALNEKPERLLMSQVWELAREFKLVTYDENRAYKSKTKDKQGRDKKAVTRLKDMIYINTERVFNKDEKVFVFKESNHGAVKKYDLNWMRQLQNAKSKEGYYVTKWGAVNKGTKQIEGNLK